MAQDQHPPMVSDDFKKQIACILQSSKASLQQASKAAENSRRDDASRPVQSSPLAKAPKPTPSFTMADALKYMGHYIPMWVSDTNDSTTDATLKVIKLVNDSSDGRPRIWCNGPWIAFDKIDKPKRAVRAIHHDMSEREKVPELVQAPMASHSLVIRRRAGDEKGEDEGKGGVLSYLTPLDEDAIGKTGEGWLTKVMLYVWLEANAAEPVNE